MAKAKLQSLFLNALTGDLVAKNDTEEGLCGYQFTQETEDDSWVITHNKNIALFLFSVFVEETDGIFVHTVPDKLEVINPNLLIVQFSQPVKGLLNLIYHVNDKDLCDVDQDIDPVVFIFGGINSFDINALEINS